MSFAVTPVGVDTGDRISTKYKSRQILLVGRIANAECGHVT